MSGPSSSTAYSSPPLLPWPNPCFYEKWRWVNRGNCISVFFTIIPLLHPTSQKNMEWTLKKQHSGSIQSTRQASSERTLIAPSLHFPSPLNATYTYYRVFLLLVNQRRESTTGYKGQVDIPLFQHLQQSHTPQKHAATRKIKQNIKNSMFIVSCHKDCAHWTTFSIHTGTDLISKKHLNPWCFASSSCSTILWIAGTYRFHTAM